MINVFSDGKSSLSPCKSDKYLYEYKKSWTMAASSPCIFANLILNEQESKEFITFPLQLKDIQDTISPIIKTTFWSKYRGRDESTHNEDAHIHVAIPQEKGN